MFDHLFVENRVEKAQFTFTNAMINLEGGHLETAAVLFAEAGRDGHVEAMVRLGNMYYIRKHYKVAFAWFKKAADRGDPEAQFYVGITNNISYLQKSANKNYPRALEALGNLYLKEGNLSAAILYLKRAVVASPEELRTHHRAKAALGRAYFMGRKWEKARHWLLQASEKEPRACYDLATLIMQRDRRTFARYGEAFKLFEKGLLLIRGLYETEELKELERRMFQEAERLREFMPSVCGDLADFRAIIPPVREVPPPILIYLSKKTNITAEDRILYEI